MYIHVEKQVLSWAIFDEKKLVNDHLWQDFGSALKFIKKANFD